MVNGLNHQIGTVRFPQIRSLDVLTPPPPYVSASVQRRNIRRAGRRERSKACVGIPNGEVGTKPRFHTARQLCASAMRRPIGPKTGTTSLLGYAGLFYAASNLDGAKALSSVCARARCGDRCAGCGAACAPRSIGDAARAGLMSRKSHMDVVAALQLYVSCTVRA